MSISGLSLAQSDKRFYFGSQTVVERGFKVGDAVLVGGDYSQPEGTIVGLSDEFPYKAQVKLSRPGGSVTCWIKSEFIG